MDADDLYYDEESSNYVAVYRTFAWIGMVIAFGWIIFGMRSGQLLSERGLLLWPGVSLFQPFELPRILGLFWLFALGSFWAESVRREESEEGAVAISVAIMAAVVVIGCGGLLALLGRWNAALSTVLLLVGTVVTGIYVVRASWVEDASSRTTIALLCAAATGTWIGPLAGLWYGLVAAVAMLCTQRPHGSSPVMPS